MATIRNDDERLAELQRGNDRLRAEKVSDQSKIRELEVALLACTKNGEDLERIRVELEKIQMNLRGTLVYLRDHELSPEQVHDMSADVLKP